MSTLYITAIIIAFAILLLLNIFFLYIPIARIQNDLDDVDERVQRVLNQVEPFIERVTPTVESLLS